MNPLSSERLIIGSVNIYDVVSHFGYQVSDLALEPDFTQRTCIISIAAIDHGVDGAESVSQNSRMLHDSVGHFA